MTGALFLLLLRASRVRGRGPALVRPFVLLAALAAGALRPSSAGASLPPPNQPRERWAVLIGRDGPGPSVTSIERQMAQMLRDSYGYHRENVIELYNEQATQEAVGDKLGELLGRMKPGDTILVYISLKTISVASDNYFVPDGGKEDEPWTMIPFADLDRLFNSANVRNALVVYPSCLRAIPAANASPQQQTSYRGSKSGRPSSVSYIWFCAPTDPPESGGPEFASATLAALRAETTHETPLTASALSEYLRKSLRGYQIQLAKSSSYSDEEFSLLPQRSRFDPLLADLRKTDAPEVRSRAIDGIVKSVLNEAPDHRSELVAQVRGPLVEVASDGSAPIALRLRAVSALGDLADKEAVIPLTSVYGAATEPELRKAAVDALGRIGGPSALRMVASALNDPSSVVRAAAIRSAGYARDESSLPRILALSSDPDERVRIAVVQVSSTFPAHAEQVRAAVAGLLGDSSTEVRRETLGALAALGRGVPASRILPILRDTNADASLRQAASLTLVRTFEERDRAAVEKGLLGAMDDPDPAVREATAFALGELGGAAAEARLIRSVKDAKAPSKVRRSAAEGLGKMQSAAAVPVLIEALRSPSTDAELRLSAVTALGAIGDPRANDALLVALKDSNVYVRGQADEALKKIRSAPRNELLAKLKDPSPRIRADAVQKLGASGTANVPALVGVLGDEDESVRQAAAAALALNRDNASVASVTGALDDKRPLVREGAATVLGRIGRTDVGDVLIRHARDPDLAVRAEVIRALGKLRHDAAERPVIDAAADAEPAVRQAAAEALGGYRSSDATAALRQLTKDAVPDVRQKAIDVLRSTTSSKK